MAAAVPGRSISLSLRLGWRGFRAHPECRQPVVGKADEEFLTRLPINVGESDGWSAAAFVEVYNLLNSDALRVYPIDRFPRGVNFSSAGSGSPPIITPPVVHVEGVRDFGRRFQVGLQVDF
jgi:hypothetical protein